MDAQQTSLLELPPDPENARAWEQRQRTLPVAPTSLEYLKRKLPQLSWQFEKGEYRGANPDNPEQFVRLFQQGDSWVAERVCNEPMRACGPNLATAISTLIARIKFAGLVTRHEAAPSAKQTFQVGDRVETWLGTGTIYHIDFAVWVYYPESTLKDSQPTRRPHPPEFLLGLSPCPCPDPHLLAGASPSEPDTLTSKPHLSYPYEVRAWTTADAGD